MATILLVIIYISFIGLGIPDSLFGTAWPAIYSEWTLPISFGSFVTVIISCGTIVFSLVSARVIARFGTNKVSAVSTLLTAVALIGFSLAPGLWAMCLLAVPLGIGAGAIDVALNNYVALHYSATHMSFLHSVGDHDIDVRHLAVVEKSTWLRRSDRCGRNQNADAESNAQNSWC